jgi:signal transduction histidine kinase
MNLGIPAAIPQVIWFGLMALGLEFLFIAIRLREDRTFLLLGTSLILLGLMLGLDIWYLIPSLERRMGSVPWLEFGGDAYQALACGYVGIALWFTHRLTGRPGRSRVLALGLILAAFAAAFLADGVLPQRWFTGLEHWQWRTTPAYDWVFAPFLICLFGYVIVLTVSGWRRSANQDRRTLGCLSIAYAILFVGGVMDILALSLEKATAQNNVIYAALGMGVMGTFIFTDRLVRLFTDQRRSMLEIARILGTIEAERPLGEIGMSAARLSLEIRSHVSDLKRDSGQLRTEMGSGHRREIERIDSARRKLERYTTGILEYSTSSRLGPRADCDPVRLLRDCVRRHMPDAEGLIRIAALPAAGPAAPVFADAGKLEKAFHELLKNAVESGSESVDVRVGKRDGRLIVEIRDRGRGAADGACERIPLPFYTTRKNQGACGLGASIAEAIVKAHGGSLSLAPGADGVGVAAVIDLPLSPRAA